MDLRPYRYAGAPRRRRPINENELVRDLNTVCRYVLGEHPTKRRPPSRVREAARTVLYVGSPGELTAVLYWLGLRAFRLASEHQLGRWARRVNRSSICCDTLTD